MTEPSNLTQFQALAAAAERGELRLDSDAAERCARACRDYIDGLNEVKDYAKDLVRLDAFGELESAQQLGRKFFNLAVGGDGSFEDVIQKHIEVAEQMQGTFLAAGAAYRAAEESTTQGIESAGSAL